MKKLKRQRRLAIITSALLILGLSAGTETFASCSANPSANYAKVKEMLDGTLHFGAFVRNYTQSADVEATIAAENVDIQSNYNFSDRNYGETSYKITITEKDDHGDPVVGHEEIVDLYKTSENNKLIGTESDVTNEEGVAHVEFTNLTPGEYEFVLEESEEDTQTSETQTETSIEAVDSLSNEAEQHASRDITYKNNHITVTISENDYSYFGDFTSDVKQTLEKARSNSYIYLGEKAWVKYQALSDADKLQLQNAGRVVVQAGDNGISNIDFDSYFAADGKLNTASETIAQMKDSKDTVVYNLDSNGVPRDSNIDSQGKELVILNIDMGSQDTFTFGQYKVDGTQANADFSSKGVTVLWNLYSTDEDGNYTPFTGTVNQNGEATGILLAPQATVNEDAGNFGGTVIAETYHHNAGEVHGTLWLQDAEEYEGEVMILSHTDEEPSSSESETTTAPSESESESTAPSSGESESDESKESESQSESTTASTAATSSETTTEAPTTTTEASTTTTAPSETETESQTESQSESETESESQSESSSTDETTPSSDETTTESVTTESSTTATTTTADSTTTTEPTDETAETGDEMNIGVFAGLLALSAIGMAAIFFRRKRA